MIQLSPLSHGGGLPQSSARTARSGEAIDTVALENHYNEVEYLASGIARTYSGRATGPITTTGATSSYTSRILARFPRYPERFSGRVVIEPFNTSTGADLDALWAHVGTLLQAQGDAWIGVTTRASSTTSLRDFDPPRYAGMELASNDLGWDVLGQIGRAVKSGGPQSPLAHLTVRRCYLGGYSQSACDVATFASAFSHCTRMPDGSAVYDGYFPAAHAASLTPIATGTAWVPNFESTAIRPADCPVVQVETQSDVQGFIAEIGPDLIFTNPGGASVRRADSDFRRDRYRLYEIAGAPHHSPAEGCDGPASTFPLSAFIRAALVNLFRWVEDDTVPPRARRITIADVDAVSSAEVDNYGNPRGGVRSPFLDVPIARYEAHSAPGPLCQLAGREIAFAPEVLAHRYTTVEAYLAEFTASLDATIAAGFLLGADRTAILQAAIAKAHTAFSPTERHEPATR